MKKLKYRKFLPSVIPLDLTKEIPCHIDSAFLLNEDNGYVVIENVTDLMPGTRPYSKYNLVLTKSNHDLQISSRIDINDGKTLYEQSDNKITKYLYIIMYGNKVVHINRYTLGLITIDIYDSDDLTTLPDYCGIEITDQLKYREVYLSGMREELRVKRDRKK